MSRQIFYKNQQELDVISFLLALNDKFYRFNANVCYFIDYDQYSQHSLSLYTNDYLIYLRPIENYESNFINLREFISLVKDNYLNNFIKNYENVDNKYLYKGTLMLPILDVCVLILNKDEMKIVDFDPELLKPTTREDLINFIENNHKNYLCNPNFLDQEDL